MKLIREHIIFEKFTEDSDPIDDIGIGIRHQIEKWIKEYRKMEGPYRESNFIINNNGTIDVDGHVNLYSVGIKKLPDYIQFNKVDGNFWINNNKLETLKGCPRRVINNFFCGNNHLSSLEFAPEYVGEKFDCDDNLVRFSKDDVLKVCKVDPKLIVT